MPYNAILMGQWLQPCFKQVSLLMAKKILRSHGYKLKYVKNMASKRPIWRLVIVH